jgi:hypothetical protein
MGLATVAAVTVALTAPGHAPKIGTHWSYSVTAKSGGRPAAAQITAQIVDPIGGVHQVDFGNTTKNLRNWPFKGTFQDFVIWPADSRGIPLTFRVTVKIGNMKKVINYPVTAR